MPTAAPPDTEAGYDRIAEALVEPGWLALPGWMPESERAALLGQLRQSAERGELRPAAIGQGATRRLASELRSDRIRWLDGVRDGAEVAGFLARMDTLRRALNQRLFLGLADYECHYAHYAPGARYDRHLDRFRGDDARTLSTVLYLNQAWQPGDGGELRIYPRTEGSKPVDIGPHPGLLVLFTSADIEHEVLPTRAHRYSVAGWMRRRSQGASATMG